MSGRVPLVLVLYAAGAGAWLAGLRIDATYHELAVFIAIAVFHGVVGLALGRVSAIGLPLVLIPVSLAFGKAGHATGELDTVFEYVLIATPFNLLGAGAGFGARAVASSAPTRDA